MKTRHFLMMATLAVGMVMTSMLITSCSKEDNQSSNDMNVLEQSLIGLWYEEFKYEDVTEDGKPFNHALIVVETKADHTGYVALAVFDDEFNEPLEI